MRKIFTLVLICSSFFAFSQSSTLVISQVFGGGGSASAPYNQDYVELHNISSVPQSLAGLSIQYATVSNAFFSTGVCVLPAVSIPPGAYFLVQLNTSTACPTCPSGIQPDYTNPTNISVGASGGKLALVSGTTAIGTACPAANVIDVIGFSTGAVPSCVEGQVLLGMSATVAAFRKDNGCQDTDNNANDFEVATPNPRRSSSPAVSCGGVITTPSLKTGRASLNFGAVTVSTTSDTLRLPLSGSNLTGAPDSITISSGNANFQLSKDNTNWATTVKVAYSNTNFGATIIVRFTPQATGVINGDISVLGGGVTTPLLIPVTGNATTATPIPADHLVISQIYGGGGEPGAVYNADYIEIFNRSTSGVSLNNYSIQYLDGTTPLKSIWTGKVKLPNVVLPGGQYFLVQMSNPGATGATLPTPDFVASPAVDISSSLGRLMLITDTVTMLNCPSTKNILDKVAYGSDICFEGALLDASRYNGSLTNIALHRFNNGCVDTDNNNLDFDTAAPAPRNLQTPSYGCGPATPTLTASPSSIDFGSINFGSTSPAAFFNLGGFNLTGAPGVINVFVPNQDFQVTLDSTNANSWSNQVGVTYLSPLLSAKKVYVRFKAQTFGLKTDSLIIYINGGNADTLKVAIRGNSVPLVPTLDATPLSPFGNQCLNSVTPKGQYQFTLSGTNLTSDSIVVAPFAGYKYATNAAGPYQDSLILFQPGGTYFETVYLIFSPTAVASYTGNIVIYGGGDTSALLQPVVGNGINSAPTVNTGSTLFVSQTTATLQGNIPDAGCTALTLYGVEYSTSQGFTNGSGIVDSSNNLLNGTYTVNLRRLVGGTTYYYKSFAENSGGGRSYSSQELSFTTALSPTPTIQSNKRTLFFDTTIVPIPSASQSFELQGYELTGAPGVINVKAPLEYQVSLDNVNFDTVVNVSYFTDTLAPTVVYVRFVPLTAANAERRITITGAGLSSPLFITMRGIGKLSPTSSVRISQIYGSGSSAGDFNADFIELHNNSNLFPQSLSGMTLQFGSASGTNWSAISLPNAVIPVGGYYLIQMSDTAANGNALPVPDFINPSPSFGAIGVEGKVALVLSQVVLGSSNCPTLNQVVDMVGYGASICSEGAPAPTVLGPSLSAFRKNGGCEDTNNNLNDFFTAQPQPRNAGFTANICIPPQPFVKPSKFTIRFGTVCLNRIGGPDSFRVTGAYLNNDSIKVKAGLGYEFSTNFAGPYADSIAFVASFGLVDQLVYVRFRPTIAADYFFTAKIYGGGSPDSASVSLRGTGASTVELKMTTGAATSVTGTSATLSGSFQSFSCDSLISYGIAYSTSAGFTTGTQALSSNLAGNNFSSDLSNLNYNTVYFYKAFAITTTDTVFGLEQNFRTNPPPRPQLVPTVLNNFGTICVGQTEGPNAFTLTCGQLTSSAINIGPLAGFLFSDSLNGTYNSSLTLIANIPADTLTVYVKFAPTTAGPLSGLIPISAAGGDTSVLASGTAFNAPPAVTTSAVTVESYISAKVVATLDDIGCSAVTERGIEYSKVDGFVSGTGIKVKADSVIGDDFVAYLRNLSPKTTYYVKAYAKNSNGTGYGEQLSFTTEDITGGLTLYPVPARPGTTMMLRHYPIESGNYTIKIFNLMGQMVYKKDNVNVIGPVFIYPVGLSSTLKTGRYTLQLESYKFLRRSTFYVQ